MSASIEHDAPNEIPSEPAISGNDEVKFADNNLNKDQSDASGSDCETDEESYSSGTLNKM
jgi:hypothetical protein